MYKHHRFSARDQEGPATNTARKVGGLAGGRYGGGEKLNEGEVV
jgi:hypothetical protein